MRFAKDVRLFFALWPEEEVRRAVTDNLRRFNIDSDKSRPVDNNNLHMTLHFVGNQPLDEMACLDRQASLVKAEPFDLSIDYAGYFKKPKVLWFACRQVPEALYELQRGLGDQISRCDFEPEQRPYSPHITVARKIMTAPPEIPLDPVHWKVERFVLVESISIAGGVRYQVAKSYALSGD